MEFFQRNKIPRNSVSQNSVETEFRAIFHGTPWNKIPRNSVKNSVSRKTMETEFRGTEFCGTEFRGTEFHGTEFRGMLRNSVTNCDGILGKNLDGIPLLRISLDTLSVCRQYPVSNGGRRERSRHRR